MKSIIRIKSNPAAKGTGALRKAPVICDGIKGLYLRNYGRFTPAVKTKRESARSLLKPFAAFFPMLVSQ